MLGEFVSALSCAGYFLSNRLRNSWSFSVEEISFFATPLSRLLDAVRGVNSPGNDELLALRYRCFECDHLIRRKLIGLPELQKAFCIEHWLQPEHLQLTSIEDMGFRAE